MSILLLTFGINSWIARACFTKVDFSPRQDRPPAAELSAYEVAGWQQGHGAAVTLRFLAIEKQAERNLAL
jgi:hypothetical protein